MNKDRYIRQILLDQIGEEGQQKLLNAHVVVVGCGGLGSIAAPYLAGAGIGRLTLIDGDVPNVSNLHRQVFFDSEAGNMSKAEVLAGHLEKLNPEIKLSVSPKMLSKDSIEELVSDADVVLECTDNIQVKYMVNDYCFIHRIPMVYGAIHKYDGYVSFFENRDKESVHLRDVFAEPNNDIPSCSEVGVMGTLAGVIGLMQANEAIKFISGAGKCMKGTLLAYNILNNDQMKLRLKKTFKADLNSVFRESSYIAVQVCASYEITINQMLSKREDYDLVSILEDHEHKDIDENVIHRPLSKIDLDSSIEIKRPTVFYCMSGVRSGTLVNKILLQNPKENVLSLQGGLRAFYNHQVTEDTT